MIFMKYIQKIFNFGSWLVLFVFILLGIFTLSANTNLFGRYHSYAVLSGSMEPSIRIADIIVIGERSRYSVGDVITFKFENHLVTHRIAQINDKLPDILYITKGDANRSEDEGQVSHKDVLGKVVLVIPKIGHFVSFSQSPIGLLLFIGIPVVGMLIDTFTQKRDV